MFQYVLLFQSIHSPIPVNALDNMILSSNITAQCTEFGLVLSKE